MEVITLATDNNYIQGYGYISDSLGKTRYGVDESVINDYERRGYKIETAFVENASMGYYIAQNGVAIPRGTFIVKAIRMANMQRCELWAATYESRDDGHMLVKGYYSSQSKAQRACEGLIRYDKPAVVRCELWKEGDRYYKVERKEVFVDVPRREDVLRKLTKEEQIALGL